MLESVKRVLVDERPESVNECIVWARKLFEDNYNHQIKQLLTSFPPDQVTSHGTKFWSGSKRCPHPLTFSTQDQEHVDFVFSAAFLRAQMYGLQLKMSPVEVAKLAAEVDVPEFVPKTGVKIAVTDQEAQEQENNQMQSGGKIDSVWICVYIYISLNRVIRFRREAFGRASRSLG